MSKLLQNLPALCNMVRRVALAAGEITLEYFDEAGYTGAESKADGSPVTLADRAAENYIRTELLALLPDVPMVGEESTAAGEIPDLRAQEYFWLVDALDGTKEFISGSGDYTVNIALIQNGAPILGIVYAPVKGELYAGVAAGEKIYALRWLEENDHDKIIEVRRPPHIGLNVVSSKSHGNSARLDTFLSGFKVAKQVKYGSSLKIVAIAAGKADLYPRLGPTCEWDTAAGHAVLRAAGGFLTDLQGKELTYGGHNPKFLNPEFVASGFEWNVTDSNG